jgi:signal peptidase I
MKLQISILILLTTYLLLIGLAYKLKVIPMVVTSNSMSPEFQYGDLLLAVGQEHYAINDIISFKINDSLVTHRIVDKQDSNLFKTQGDSNQLSDSILIKPEQIVGKIRYIFPKLGFVILIIQTQQAKLTIIGLMIIYLMIKTLNKMKKYLIQYEQ